MSYDGTLKFDTRVDSTGFKTGLSKLNSLAKTGISVLGTAVAAAGTAITAAGGFAVKAGMDYEAQMSRVKAISEATDTEFAQLNEQAKKLGADTAFSASEAAQGVENLAAAGFSVNEITSAMPGLLDLAAASGEDLATSSEIAASTLRAFGMEAEDAGHVADVLAANANKTNAAVVDTGYAMKYAAPVCNSLGISMEETAAAIGLMANKGIKGEQAGTTLRGALTRLLNPTDKMSGAIKTLGVEFFDSEGKMKSLSQMTGELRTATKGMTDEQRNSALAAIFGTESLSGMLALIDSAPGELDTLTKAYENCDGAAKNAAETMMDNLKGALDQLTGSVETLGLNVYEKMETPLKEAVQTGVEYVNRLSDSFSKGGLQAAVEEAGNIFAELATKAAESAPAMIDASVKFIQSFIEGIAANSDKLGAAAQSIVKSLVNGLVSLLPKAIQKPVREAVKAMEESFTKGGLKKAIDTTGNLFKSLGKVLTSVAKTVLPILTKAVDFLGSHLNVILPLIAGVTAGVKTWNIINSSVSLVKSLTASFIASAMAVEAFAMANSKEAIATAVSTGALTLKQIAVGVLTGQIGFATAAQWLWNAAMNANPIGIAALAVGALVTALGYLTLSQHSSKESAEKLAESYDDLGNTFGSIGQKTKEYYDGIQNAKGIFDGLNDSIFVSQERQQTLADEMDGIQAQITKIAGSYADKRIQYNEEEIQKLDELFAQMHQKAKEELEIQKSYQEAAQDMAQSFVDGFTGTAEQYASAAQDYLKSAEDTRAQVVAKAKEQYMEEIASANQAYKAKEIINGLTKEQALKAAYDTYQGAVTSANDQAGETTRIIQEGYLKTADSMKEHLQTAEIINSQVEKENKLHNENLKKIQDDWAYMQEAGMSGELGVIVKNYWDTEDEKKRHNLKMDELNQQMDKNLDQSTQNQLASWVTMLTQQESYGKKITGESEKLSNSFLTAFANLPEESKKKMSEVMNGMIKGVQEKAGELFKAATSIASGFLSKLTGLTGFDIHSPSKKTRKIFRQVVEGAEIGLEDKETDLYDQSTGIASGIMERFKAAKLDVSALVQRMKAAVYAEQQSSVIGVRAGVAQQAAASGTTTAPAQPEAPHGPDTVEAHIYLNDREFATAIAPAVSKQMGWKGATA